MTRVLLTGASGFIAAHILSVLLDHGHFVVASVRSNEKAQKIRALYPNIPTERLGFAIVKDISNLSAFDDTLKSDPSFEAVIHTASPFELGGTNPNDLLNPAVNGTVGILHAIKKYAPNVTRVIITSSFAAMIDLSKPNGGAGYVYSEKDWNPVTLEDVMADPTNSYRAYRASKTLAEKASWEFIKNDAPAFTLTTICPPFVFGPLAHPSPTEVLNTSNHLTRDFMLGRFKSQIPETGDFIWVDVRDLALAHARAMENEEAANKRFFVTAGYFSNRQIATIMRDNFPELRDQLPGEETTGGDLPEGGMLGYDNSQAVDLLGLTFRPLEACIIDSVKSIQKMSQ